MNRSEIQTAILERIQHRYEVEDGMTVPGGLLTKVWRWCGIYGEGEVLDVLGQADKMGREGAPVRSLGKWMETVLAERAAAKSSSSYGAVKTPMPLPPCGCKDGFDEASRKCCPRCPRGRERAKTMRLMYERDFVHAMEKVRSIEAAKKLEALFAGKLSALFTPIPKGRLEA